MHQLLFVRAPATKLGNAFALLLIGSFSCAAVIACGEDPADSLKRTRRGSSSGSTESSTDPNGDITNPDGTKVSPEEAKFRALEGDLLVACGKSCHDLGTYVPPAPTFLAGPNLYQSIKAHPGIVVRDVYASSLLTKGSHAGPALNQNVELEKRVVEWLEAEAILIQAQKLPSTPPFTVAVGPNDIDLTPAATPGLSGVHLKFDATLTGTMLSLSKITLVAPAGQDVHVLQPRFVRVLAQPLEDGTTDITDPADSFSNSDQTFGGGKEATLSPGYATFSAASWRPFDMAKDKLRIEMTKLEPGKVAVIANQATCKDVGAFTANVLGRIRNQGTSANNNCGGCHGGGLGGLNLASQDNGLICQQVLGKLNQGNIAQSAIITKVTGGMPHQGGTVPDANAWRALFQNNAGAFY